MATNNNDENLYVQASLEALHKRLEKEWERRLESSLSQWRSEADKTLNRSMKALLEVMAHQLANQLQETTLARAMAGSAAANSHTLEQQIGGLAARMLAATLADIVDENRTKRVSRETGRSQDAASLFTQSRGQVKAQKAREVAKGQRNL